MHLKGNATDFPTSNSVDKLLECEVRQAGAEKIESVYLLMK